MGFWKHGRTFWGDVPLEGGRRRQRSFGTDSKRTAKEMERMLSILKGRREWRILEYAANGPLSVGKVFDAYRQGDEALKRLLAGLDDVDLNKYVEPWRPWAERHGASAKTVADYVRQLRALIPEGKPFPRSEFTKKHVAQTQAALPVAGPTVRRYRAAWSCFANYLIERDVIDHNPVGDVKAPPENDPREVFLQLPDVQRLVDAQSEPYRTLAALREGAGVEISAALAVRKRDVGPGAKIVHVHGTKNRWRNRPVFVESWARPYLLARIKTLLPDALLFDGADNDQAAKVHKRALKALKLREDYRLHDARHSFAVRQMQARTDPNLIASNLGHKDATMVLRNYGKHRPRELADFADILADNASDEAAAGGS